ncbi:MAG: GNAT family N-acetyltransferase [Gaiella sp.]
MRAADPPYLIRTERLTIRCWEPPDAPLLKDALDTSLDHLRPWMPWASEEPQTLAEKVALLRRFRGRFDLGEDFVYGIFTRDENEVVGGAGLHARVGEGGLEIGYWLRSSRLRQGHASDTVSALTRVAFAVCGVERVEIRIDPANAASLRVPRRLGFVEEATLQRRLPAAAGETVSRNATIFTVFAEAFGATPMAKLPVEGYGAAGERVF